MYCSECGGGLRNAKAATHMSACHPPLVGVSGNPKKYADLEGALVNRLVYF